MRSLAIVCLVVLSLSSLTGAASQTPSTGLRVAVIAPSTSTSREARAIRLRLKWQEVPLRQADAILVVVRSSLSFPLNGSYDSIKALQDDAGNQLNISGPKFHVYLYRINDDLSVSESEHRHHAAEER